MKELNYIQKPDARAFEIMRTFLKDGKKIIFIDDELVNVKEAKKIGCITVLIRKNDYGNNHGY